MSIPRMGDGDLVMDWLIVGTRLIPDTGRVRVMATRTTRAPEIIYVTSGALKGEYRFSAKSDDVVVVEARTYAEALRQLGDLWDADRAGRPTPALPASRPAIEEKRAVAAAIAQGVLL